MIVCDQHQEQMSFTLFCRSLVLMCISCTIFVVCLILFIVATNHQFSQIQNFEDMHGSPISLRPTQFLFQPHHTVLLSSTRNIIVTLKHPIYIMITIAMNMMPYHHHHHHRHADDQCLATCPNSASVMQQPV